MQRKYKSPRVIYLQVDPDTNDDHNVYGGITWCEDRINDTDVKYIRHDPPLVFTAVEPDGLTRCPFCDKIGTIDERGYCGSCGHYFDG
jgi:hypothetical protein